jgi:hypothetical protein
VGDITPVVMREFEDACIGYFKNKEIPDDKKVHKILVGFRDSRIKDWISTDRQHLLTLDFDAFMMEFRVAYLDDDWEEMIQRELGSMMQGSDLFWDFTIHVQAKNSLLISTPSYLDDDKLHHRIEASMEEFLVRRCTNAKTNQEHMFKKWLTEVKRIDNLMCAERKEFITKATWDSGCHANLLGEPSNHENTSTLTSLDSKPSSSPIFYHTCCKEQSLV